MLDARQRTTSNAAMHQEKRREQQAQRWQVPVGGVADMQEWRKMMTTVLTLPPGVAMELAVLRSCVRFTQDVYSYMHALQPNTTPSLLGGPLITWDMRQVGRAVPVAVAVLRACLPAFCLPSCLPFRRTCLSGPFTGFAPALAAPAQVDAAGRQTLVNHLNYLITYLRANNPLVEKFKTAAELHFKPRTPAAAAADGAQEPAGGDQVSTS